MDILIDYNTINIGKDGEEKTYDVIDMVFFYVNGKSRNDDIY